ncbi:MAG: rhodanese-like domain-containing protein, partial [Methanoculleus thermophilus]|nr:rhodanese-like domain-containing protein [Methanoculleus thermophilus]
IAASILQKHGFSNVINLLGGTIGWEAANYPMIKEEEELYAAPAA